jgi:hypothetical protein
VNLPAAFVPLRDAMVAVDRPDHARGWLAKPEVRRLLAAIGSAQRPVTHALLDELGHSKTLDYLRAVLVASSVLPDRDETITRLERWIVATVEGRDQPDDRRILHGYAVWHHLRRLRGRLDGRPATVLQEWYVRTCVIGAVQLLDFLADRGMRLRGCTQAEVDEFLANVATYPADSAAFVRWAVKNKHASGLTAPATRWVGPTGPHDEQARWDTARRLMHDDGLPIRARVAGLLLVLYAQHLSSIVGLTVDHVAREHDTVTIRLGAVPIVLPPPLDALMSDLIATRRGNTLLDTPGTWLFPGRHPGKPSTAGGLALELRNVGVRPRQHRNTALFSLAAQLPAAVLARMLGIHIDVAVQWQRASAGDWNAYAADVATRPVRPDS